MVHLAWNKNLIPVYFKKILDFFTENGFYKKVSKTLITIMNVISEYLAKKDLHLVSKNPEIGPKILEKYLLTIAQLPKISKVGEENLENVIAQNFEGIIDILKISINMILDLKKNNLHIEKSTLQELYTEIVEPNIVQLYSETPTVFYKCVSKGDSNLKNKFFEICLTFCKIDSEYMFKTLHYLTTVYKKNDFDNNEY